MPIKKKRIQHAAIVTEFGERLRGLRESRNLTQKDLAARAKITLSYVSRLEAGGAAPGLDLIERVAGALEVEISELIPGPPDPGMEELRTMVRERAAGILPRAGLETLKMLNALLERLSGSPDLTR